MRVNSSIKIGRALTAAAGKCRWISTSLDSVPEEAVDAVVIGAGVVGVAVARELAAKGGIEVLVVESAPTFGTGSSSRNSEVIHAGIYYPRNSLKARFCIRGWRLLYDYCREHGIPHKQIGKLIVATQPSEISKLNELMSRGIENGVDGLRMMEGREAVSMEPELYCTKALMSPLSGIIDSHSLMQSLLGEAESSGAIFSYNTTVIGGRFEESRLQLFVSESEALRKWDGKSPLKPDLVLTRIVVNSAGLGALALSRRIHGLDNGIVPRPYFACGCYFTLSNVKSPLFNHLIYPIPEDGGLGDHVTLDLNGRVKFGPMLRGLMESTMFQTSSTRKISFKNAEYPTNVDSIPILTLLLPLIHDQSGDQANRFYPEIRKYYPHLRDGSLEAGYAGIRPKISGPMQAASDFIVQGKEVHGVGGLVNPFGIESPGLAASMAIAEHVAAKYNG